MSLEEKEKTNNTTMDSWTCLFDLSDEILLLIISNLGHQEDIVNLSNTCTKMNYLLLDRTLSNNLKFSWNVYVDRISLVKFLKNPVRQNVITVLNIQDLYWLPSWIIRDIGIKLVNLQQFYIAGTRFSWNHFCEFLKTDPQHLTHLSWTLNNALEDVDEIGFNRTKVRNKVWCEELLEIKPQLSRLHCLVFHIPALTASPITSKFSLTSLVSACTGLKELWIFSWIEKTHEGRSLLLPLKCIKSCQDQNVRDQFRNLNSLVFDVQGPLDDTPPLIRMIVDNLKQNVKNNQLPLRRVCFDGTLPSFGNQFPQEIDLSYVESLTFPIMNFVYTDIRNLNLINCKKLKLARRFVGDNVDLNGVCNSAANLETFYSKSANYSLEWDEFISQHPKLSEINICQDGALPYPQYCIALSSLENLRKLSIPQNSLREIKESGYLVRFKKDKLDRGLSAVAQPSSSSNRRVAHQVSRDRICGLDFITTSCHDIDEFELGFSSSSRVKSGCSTFVMESLISIRNFTKLTKLTLDNIPIRNGQFLVEIAKACKLESLRLSNIGPSGNCVYIKELLSSLRILNALRDFRLEQNYIGTPTSLFTAMVGCKQLQRITIICQSNDKSLTVEPLVTLMESCRRLSALFIVVDKTPKILCKDIRLKLTSLFKISRPCLSIVIRNDLNVSIDPLNYPSVHDRQLVTNYPHVCAQAEFPIVS